MSKKSHRPKCIPIADEEDVARIIYSPSYIDGDNISPSAFNWEYMVPSGDPEDYISVLRDDGKYNLDEESRCMRARKPGDTRFGYALLNVGGIRKIPVASDGSISVEPKPTHKRTNHAGIFLYLNGNKVTADTDITPERMYVQKQLALLCTNIVQFKVNEDKDIL